LQQKKYEKKDKIQKTTKMKRTLSNESNSIVCASRLLMYYSLSYYPATKIYI